MGLIAASLLGVGVVGLIWGLVLRLKAGRLGRAPLLRTGAVTGDAGVIAVEGDVICPQPLRSPVSGCECLYYEYTVTAHWSEGDVTRSRELACERAAAPLSLDDGSGAVRVDASRGGAFELTVTHDERKATGLQGVLHGELKFGELRVSTANAPLYARYHVVERVLRQPPRLVVCGQASPSGIGSPPWTSMIVSSKSRAQLLGFFGRSAQLSMISGGAATTVGLLVGLLARAG